jgi:integrase
LKPPKYPHRFVDRFGKARFYLRMPRRKRVPLPGLPWSPEFMAARERAMNEDWEPVAIGASRTIPGTVNAALVSYYQSIAFAEQLAITTRQSRRAILELFRSAHGDKRIALMHSQALQNILSGKKPATARNWKKALRGFVDHCVSIGIIQADPLASVKLPKMKKTSGFYTWTEEEIAQYENHHAPGTKARLALVLLLQTGHARADVVRMGRQHVKASKLSMRRQKTGVQFDIPVLPDLLAELELHPRTGQLVFLTTSRDEPFTAAGFGNWFRERCNEAELPHCTAHGLRKAAAVRHALHGATAPELMAWFGWKTIGEAQRYIEAANRVRLAESAAEKVISRTGIGKPKNQFAKSDHKSLKKRKAKP